jgi:hypothetical protein
MVPEMKIAEGEDVVEREVTLGRHGVLLTKTSDGGSIRLRSPEGAETLSIEITPAGAVLRLSRGLTVEIAGPLSLDADQVSIHGRQGLSLSSGGDITAMTDGSVEVRSHSATITATRGDIVARANDDIILAGERIRANC